MSGRRILFLNAIFKRVFCLFGYIGMMLAAATAHADTQQSRLLILCYHDIPLEVNLDKYGVDQISFVQQLEYLRNHGYHFVSVENVIQANKGEKELPEKAVLLTFDDAYESFYINVFPLLKLYNYPAVLSVVTSWIDNPPEELSAKLMSWPQIVKVARSGRVEIASHSHGLHKAILYNPYGNTGWAATSRRYEPNGKTYESEEIFRERVSDDITQSLALLKKKTGVNVRVLTWPYGRYNLAGMEEARGAGIKMAFDIADTPADIHSPYSLPRVMVVNNPSIQDFIRELNRGFQAPVKQRVVQIDLDAIYDEDSKQMERNLDALINRLYAMKVSTVYLQAFCDKQGNGNISAVYFPNRVLPMKADIFNRVVNQLAIRDMEVYAWMPLLSIVLPNAAENEALRVREWKSGGIAMSRSWYARLTPFSEKTADKLRMLYEDMALNARIDGVVFLDDGYLNESEDFHPEAMEAYKKISGKTILPPWELEKDAYALWTKAKINALNTLTEKLMDTVRRYRPRARFARTLYAEALINPQGAQEHFSQDYAQSLKRYDYVNIMAYPLMEKVPRPVPWLKSIVKNAQAHQGGLVKTVFKLQAYDWKNKRWVSTRQLKKWMRVLVSEGAYHIGYYPDDCIGNRPKQESIRMMMSIENFPFKTPAQKKVAYP